jgi:predicted Zn-dependent peptidase
VHRRQALPDRRLHPRRAAPWRDAGEGAAPVHGRSRVERTELPNGVRILSEEIRELPSVAIAIWVESGSRYELPEQNGLSHFIEHLFFKGTERRSAKAISEEIDAVGGDLNADTERELTCYEGRVVAEQAPLAIDLLADIFLGSRLDPADIEREKSVVCEEIAQIEDTPDDWVHDLFQLQYWADHPLGRPVCGSRETVERFDRRACLGLLEHRYRPDRIIVAAAGGIAHDTLVAEVERRFSHLRGTAPLATGDAPRIHPGVHVFDRKLEQVQLCLATGGVAAADPAHDAAAVLNVALGGSPSSRLFQEVRERRGRAYSIDSFLCSYRDTGYLAVSAGTQARWVPEVVEIVLRELRQIRSVGLPPDELARAKGKLKGTLLLSLETSGQRMERLAFDESYLGRQRPLAEIAAGIDAVTNDDVVALAERLFVAEHCALVLLGRLGRHRIDADVFGALG